MSKTCLMRLRTKPGSSTDLAVEKRFPVELVAGLTCINLVILLKQYIYACKCFENKAD